MTDIRPSMTLAYAKRKRETLLKELKSDQHYCDTETISYGSHNPFNVTPIPGCDDCNGAAQMQKVKGVKVRWTMVCKDCGKTIDSTQAAPWQAALMWCGQNLKNMDYTQLPLFGLNEMDVTTAMKRMTGIRHNLELRKALAGIESTIAQKTGTRPPGKDFRRRIEAYLKWSMLALRLIKYQKAGK